MLEIFDKSMTITFHNKPAISVEEDTTSVFFNLQVQLDDGNFDENLIYSIGTDAATGGADYNAFEINSATGELNFITAPDYESNSDTDRNNVYELTFTVTEDGGLYDTATFDLEITVTDIIEVTPVTGYEAFYNLATLDITQGAILTGAGYGSENKGWSVSSAGDINDDGIDDVIIGAWGAKNTPDNKAEGKSYIVFGNSGGIASSIDLNTLDGNNGFVIQGVDEKDRTGSSVSSAGDFNGDGIDDIIIGVPRADLNGNSNVGETYVVFGRPQGTDFDAILNLSSLGSNDGFKLNGIDHEDYSGISVSSAGDINGDGYDDLIIGAYYAESLIDNYSNAGEAYVVFGFSGNTATAIELSSLDGSNGFVFHGFEAKDFTGISASNAGDINGDGYDDLIIGSDASGGDSPANTGETYVIFGQGGSFEPSLDSSDLNGINGFTLKSPASERFGFSVANAGDINGDGYDDLVIGAPSASPNGNSKAGKTYVAFGSNANSAGSAIDLSSLDGSNGFVLNGVDAEDYSGASVAGVGDVNGDGYDDIIIGAYVADGYAGEAYLVFGFNEDTIASIELSGLDGSNGFKLSSDVASSDWFALSVAGAGDVNEDGYDDLIIGAPKANGNKGESYLIYGGAAIQNEPHTITGITEGAVTEDTFLTTSGSFVLLDPEGKTATDFAWSAFDAAYGTIDVETNGDWTYTLNTGNLDVQTMVDGDTLGDTFTIRAEDAINNSDQLITITVKGIDEFRAIIGGTITGALTEDDTSNNTASGTLTITDTDLNEAEFIPDTHTGTYGSLDIDVDGIWTYTLNNDNDAATQTIPQDIEVDDIITIYSFDNTPQDITITVTGVNDAATITGTTIGEVTEDADQNTVSGNLSLTDIDSGEDIFAEATYLGAYGSLDILANGDWTYSLNNDNDTVNSRIDSDTLTDTINIKSPDGTDSTDIIITINGAEDDAKVEGTLTGTVVEDSDTDGTATGTITISDPDRGDDPAFVDTTTPGTYGTLTLTSGTWIYELTDASVQFLKAGANAADTITLPANDTTTKDITITINGANDPATITGTTTGTVTEDTNITATGTLTITDDDDGDDVFNEDTIPGTYGSLEITSAGVWTYSLNNSNNDIQGLGDGDTLTDSITIESPDGTDTDIVITINGADEPVVRRTPTPTPAPPLDDAVQPTADLPAAQTTPTDNDDTLALGRDDDVVPAGNGDDDVHGGNGNDTIGGGNGDDTIEGGDGVDYLFGGSGNDVIYAATEDDPAADDDGNVVWAGTGNDTVIGSGGNDTLGGGDDDDSVTGGNGDDLIYGGAGNDTVLGGAGDDTIYGGFGNDTLSGGSGEDTFFFSLNSGDDQITDFELDEDVLDLSETSFTDLGTLTAAAEDTANGLLITLSDNSTILLSGLSLSDLSTMNITFG